MVIEEFITNAGSSTSTSIQIGYHEGSDPTSSIMCDVSVKTNFALDSNKRDENFEFCKQ